MRMVRGKMFRWENLMTSGHPTLSTVHSSCKRWARRWGDRLSLCLSWVDGAQGHGHDHRGAQEFHIQKHPGQLLFILGVGRVLSQCPVCLRLGLEISLSPPALFFSKTSTGGPVSALPPAGKLPGRVGCAEAGLLEPAELDKEEEGWKGFLST